VLSAACNVVVVIVVLCVLFADTFLIVFIAQISPFKGANWLHFAIQGCVANSRPVASAIFVNENENGEKQENNEFVNKN